jgi:adenylate kinase
VVILLFGPPGSGKGTQAAYMTKVTGYPAISTGEIFRAELKAGSPLGRAVKEIMSSGGLVPDELTNQIVANRLSARDCRAGFLLDGYPRSIAQAQFLDKWLAEHHMPAVTVVHLDVPLESLVARLTARRQCPQCGHIYNLLHQPPVTDGVCDFDGRPLLCREDDKEHVIRQRIVAYEQTTGPLINYYSRSNYFRIDGSTRPEEIARQIEAILEPVAAEESKREDGVEHAPSQVGDYAQQ